jgi:hypothetical protein
LSARTDKLTRANLALAHDSVSWCNYLRVAEICSSQVKRGFLGIQVGAQLEPL